MPPKVLFRYLVAAPFAASIAYGSAIASAQELPSIDARTWRPSTDPNASMVVEPATTPGAGVLSFGGYASYSLWPITVRRAGSDEVAYRPVEHQLVLDAIANVGLGERFAIGAAFPVLPYQAGDVGLPKAVSDVDKVPTTGIGDLGLSMKGAIVRNEGGGFGLAGLGYVTFPTGSRTSFLGEGAMTVSARVLAEYSLVIAALQGSLGYKLRTDHRTWPAAAAGGYPFGDELPWTLGLSMRPGVLGVDPGNRQRWEIAAHGWLPAGPAGPFGSGDPGSAALSPVLLGLSDRIELGHYHDAYLLAGAELGLNRAVGVPVVRGVVSIGWAPREHDMDHDGVKDDVDGCPEIPEDKDGFEDSDGCPEIDNDDDGVLDKEDACVAVAGAPSTDPKKNGCPLEDQDGDGIDDQRDRCPTEPEDKDGFEDSDGCPEIDNDDDGVLDKEDACVAVAGAPSTDPKKNGCPLEDQDGDGIGDEVDACPKQKGVASSDPKTNGCAALDTDGDGIDDQRDRCPTEPEDKDGFEDGDGCPEPDNDGDGIRDREDACPNEKGQASADPARSGCPNLDRDGDTYNNDVDKCPDAAEVWNGVDDDDGCPDQGGKSLVAIDDKRAVRLGRPIRVVGKDEAFEVDPTSMPTLRALASELNRHADWTLAIGVRPAGGDPSKAQLDSLARSFAVVRALSALSRRDGVAETVGWDAVKNRPQADTGMAFLILVTPQATPEKKP